MPSFHLVFKDGQKLKQIIDLCKDIVCDVSFEISDNGIFMQAMDMSHVSLVSFLLEKKEFEDYSLYGNNHFVISLSLRNLNLILKSYRPSFKLSFAYDKEDEKLQIIYNFISQECDTDEQYTFSLQLFNMENECLQIPTEEYDCSLTMNSQEMYDMLKNISIFQDSLRIAIVGKVVTFETTGDFGNVVFCKSFPKTALKSKFQQISFSYSMKYLSMFSKAYIMSKNVEIGFQEEQPIHMSYQFDGGKIEFHLAPKIE